MTWYLIPTVLGVIFLTFTIIHGIPGNPAEVITMMLAAVTLLFALFFGVSTGVFCALKPNSGTGFLMRGISVAGISLPEFWSSGAGRFRKNVAVMNPVFKGGTSNAH